MNDDERKAAIQALGGERCSLDQEFAAFALLPPAKRAIVDRRLEVFRDYVEGRRAPGRPSAREHGSTAAERERPAMTADAAAAALGMARRNFHRLLSRIDESGPVKALAPGLRSGKRPGVVRDGFPERQERALAEFMAANPAVSTSTIEAFVKRAFANEGLVAPSPSSIARRVAALRASSRLPASAVVLLGRSLLVDQSALNLPVRHFEEVVYGTVTLIIDRSSRLICGVGVTTKHGSDLGLQSALLKATSRRLPEFGEAGVPVADRLEELTWVVPPQLEWAGDLVWEANAHSGVVLKIVNRNPQRHGAEIVRMIGNRLGPFQLKVRATGAGESYPDSEERGVQPEEGLRLLRWAADVWNAEIVRTLNDLGSQPREDRLSRLDNLRAELERLFAPLFAAIDRTYVPDEPRNR